MLPIQINMEFSETPLESIRPSPKQAQQDLGVSNELKTGNQVALQATRIVARDNPKHKLGQTYESEIIVSEELQTSLSEINRLRSEQQQPEAKLFIVDEVPDGFIPAMNQLPNVNLFGHEFNSQRVMASVGAEMKLKPFALDSYQKHVFIPCIDAKGDIVVLPLTVETFLAQRMAQASEAIAASQSEKPTSANEKVSSTLEQASAALQKAKELGTARMIAALPTVPEGQIRLFRGVKPKAVATEFNKLSDADRNKFSAIVELLMKDVELDDQQKRFLEENSALMLGGEQKWCADNYETVRDRYAGGGAIFYLDLPKETAWKYYRFNGLLENASAIPFDFYQKKAKLCAVGPNLDLASLSRSLEVQADSK